MTSISSPDLSGHSLLAVFAHPDDESISAGGLLAWSADLGARITIACLTRGEHQGGKHREQLGDTRVLELKASAEILGVDDLVILNHQDGMLPWTDADALENDIGKIVNRVAPDVVITFGEDGLYWHPDHIAVHERTTAVIARITKHPPGLYYVTIPTGRMQALIHHVVDYKDWPPYGQPLTGILGVKDANAFGSHASPPTVVLSVAHLAKRKLRAIQCHESQVKDTALGFLHEEDAARFLGTEHYRRANVGSQEASFMERLIDA